MKSSTTDRSGQAIAERLGALLGVVDKEFLESAIQQVYNRLDRQPGREPVPAAIAALRLHSATSGVMASAMRLHRALPEQRATALLLHRQAVAVALHTLGWGLARCSDLLLDEAVEAAVYRLAYVLVSEIDGAGTSLDISLTVPYAFMAADQTFIASSAMFKEYV